MKTPVSLYLDTNAVAYLFDRRGWNASRLQSVRAALARACQDGRIRLVASFGLAEELAGVRTLDSSRYVRMVKYLFGLAGPHVLLPLPERIKKEVVLRNKLEGRQPYLGATMLRELRARLMDPAFTAQVHTEVAKLKELFENDRRVRREEIRGKLGSDTPALTRRWWREAPPIIDAWVVDDLRASRVALGLPTDEALWPSAREVFSAWHNRAFQLARIALTVGDNRRIQGADLWDAIHYADAIYVDVMVTDDKGFRETCDAVPDRPFHVENFETFARDRLGVG